MMIDLPFDVVELVPCPMTSVRGASPLRETSFRKDAWLPEDIDRLHAMFRSDEDFGAIEAATGRSIVAIRSKIGELGLRRNSSQPWTDLELEELARRYGVDATSSIAADFGRSVAAVYARAGALGLTETSAPPYTAWELAQIRAAYADGVPVAQLAVLIGRPASGIATVASRLGLVHANAPADWSAAEQQRALALAENGRRYRQIALDLAAEGFPARTHNAVGQVLRKLGYGRGWGRPWAPEEDDLLRATYARGDSLTPTRRRLGRSVCSIRWRAAELGLQGTHARPNGWRTEPPWTENEIAILRRDYGRVPTPQLAAGLGRKKGGVFNKAWSLGLVHGYLRPFAEEEKTAIRIAHRTGISLTDLSAALDRDPAVVSKHAIRHLGLSFRDRPNKAPRGKRCLRPRLTLADILGLAGQPCAPPTPRDGERQNQSPPAPGVTTPKATGRAEGAPELTPKTHPAVPVTTVVAGPGAPCAPQAILHGMLAAGLLTPIGRAPTGLMLLTAHPGA